MNKVLFSSMSDEWRTPQSIFDKLDKEFHFDCDPCPMQGKPLKKGLINEWDGKSLFINPPYSEIGKWLEKGISYHDFFIDTTVVFLLPSRTDTKWWHEYVMNANEIRFIKGRLHFNEHKNSAPFPSCVVVFK